MAFRSGVQAASKRAFAQRRFVSTNLEDMARRPLSSSYAYRAVQDWKPVCRDVAHSRGEEIQEEQGTTCMMNMMLIDSMGYRWPIRFRKTPTLTLLDLFLETDEEWFGVRPGPRKNSKPDTVPKLRSIAQSFSNRCSIGNSRSEYCWYCAVAVPFEYLDAMSPPSQSEVEWLRNRSDKGIIWPASNLRLACQVEIEDWMDGMTVVLPQGDSMVFQMYHQHGGNRDGVDMMISKAEVGGLSYGMHGNGGRSYLSSEKNTQKAGTHPGDSWRDAELNMDSNAAVFGATPEGAFVTSKDGDVPLSTIFWTDDIDMIIRQKDPTWKGRYEFLK